MALTDDDGRAAAPATAQTAHGGWWQELLESSGDPVIRFGRDLVAVDGNQAAAQRLGVAPGAQLPFPEAAAATLRDLAVPRAASEGIWKGALTLADRDAESSMTATVVACGGDVFAAMFQPSRETIATAGDGPASVGLDLEGAIARGEMRLHYQPKVNLRTGEIIGVEALVRWQHPEQGLLPPGAFVPAAEETGLIVPLGLWVLEEACRQSAAWNSGRPRDEALFVAANVSPIQLSAPGVVDSVGAILGRTGAHPASMVIEITESVVADRGERTMQALNRLRELGFRIAIDDFGSGYSSLGYIKAFDADILKIDRAFVADLESDQHDWEIVNSVVALAHAMDMRVVAEGVESGEQAGALRTLGADYAQGYHFARPAPADEVERLVARPPWMLAAAATISG